MVAKRVWEEFSELHVPPVADLVNELGQDWGTTETHMKTRAPDARWHHTMTAPGEQTDRGERGW